MTKHGARCWQYSATTIRRRLSTFLLSLLLLTLFVTVLPPLLLLPSHLTAHAAPPPSGNHGGSGTAANDDDDDDAAYSSWYVRVTLPRLGTLQGIRSLGVDFFGGIPYAAPPVGNLRWSPPEEPPSWKPHVLDATQFGPDCYQVVDSVMNPLADPNQMSEDCLYLNIYTPAGASSFSLQKLPVMVWFHGGAFQQGAAKRPEYDGRRLARDMNVIVVTANYRLGSLGFLVSSELGLLGNYGLMDQRAVLYFVKEHIHKFGGDSESITLFGESAGAVMIGLHLLMDNPGLFHRAILQSNPMGYQFRSVVVADFLGDALRRAVDCRDLACMKAEPVQEIMRAQSSLMGIPRSVGDFFAWGPTLTHHRQVSWNAGGTSSSSNAATGSSENGIAATTTTSTIKPRPMSRSADLSTTLVLEERSLFSVETYAKQRESTKFAVNVSQPLLNLHLVPDEIPIIIGTNKHEGEMFVHSAFPLTMSKAVYWMFVGALFKDSASRVLKHYRTYVTQLENEAQAIAEQQLLEEENRQYYLEHFEELEQEYAWLMMAEKQTIQSESNSNDDNNVIGEEGAQVISPETVEQLVQTFNSGGDQQDEQEEDTGNTTVTSPWWRRAMDRVLEKPDPHTVEAKRLARLEQAEAKRLARQERIKERARQKALKEAAKVVVDYRPVMSRIINDYLFRCPSWHYAHLLSRNRVRKHNKTNNVYVYRFSQPTHVPGYKECWGKSCHTSELPYVFRSMDVIRTNYSTLSKIAQDEAPAAPEYPYTAMMNAYRGILEADNSTESSSGGASSTPQEESNDAYYKYSSSASGSSHQSNHTTSFQRILKHFFDDYFQRDADDETSADMAQRWVAFARSGDPNYEDSKIEWEPWRYIKGDFRDGAAGKSMDEPPTDPLEGFVLEDDFWKDAEHEGDSWEVSEERLGRALRERALQALNMEVIEEDELRTELRRTKATKPDPDNPFFSLNFLSHLGITSWKAEVESALPREAVRQIQRAAQEMGVLGTGVRGDDRSGRSFQPDDDFFPQLLELMWPPESRLVERDCTCDFWDRIRYRY